MAKIVLAGEDLEWMDSVRATIESMGHEVFFVESALDVVDEVLEQEAALAVLDESMATFDGYEVAQMLRDEPNVPDVFSVLLLVSEGAVSGRLERAGVSECFVKGHNSAELSDLLVKMLGDEAGVGLEDEAADFLKG